jgi:hypothetical protein
MQEFCHRCHADLPQLAPGSSRGDEDAILFCPRCAAPQIHLPDYMRVEAPVATTTGALPPPRLFGAGPGAIDWRAVLTAATVVAAVGVLLTILSLQVGAFSVLGLLWTLSAGSIALALYARLRPQAQMDARVGMRVGVTAGLLMLAAMGVGLAATGVVLRYGTHGMEQFDKANADQRKAILTWFQQNIDDKEVQEKFAEDMNSPRMNSPEMRAGSALAGLGMQATLILLIAAGTGALVGRMRASPSARPGLRRGD